MDSRRSVLFAILLGCAAICSAKMHIHTDAADYRAGERIWFRIHMLDARTLLSDTTTDIVLVELLDPQGEVTKRVKLLRWDGIFAGYMDIPSHAEAGQYMLRSYLRGGDSNTGCEGKQIVYIHGTTTNEPSAPADRSSLAADSDVISVPQVAMPLQVTGQDGLFRICIGTDSLLPGERVMVSASVTDRYAISRHPQWNILYTFSHAPFDEPVSAVSFDCMPVRGYVLTPVRRKAVKGALVNMIVPGLGYAQDTTDSEGRFVFMDELVSEGTSVVLAAYRPDGGQNVIIRTEEERFPSYRGIAPALVRVDQERYITRIELNDVTDSVVLDEIEVNAKRLIQESSKELHSMYQADLSFGMNKINEYNATSLFDLLRRVPGLYIEEEKCYIRGAHSIYAKNPAAIALNGVIQEGDFDLNSIPMQDIARLDIFKSGTTVIWGSRGGAGVISIILKDGTEIPRQTDRSNLVRCTPLGWQKPQTFYVPSYAESSKRPATILWIPDVQSPVLTFSTDGHATLYEVVIEGVTTHGRLVYQHCEIPVM